MKVVCDNCRAVYKVPDEKLVKPVNKATCRNCNHRMLIPRPKPNADPEERTLVTAVAPTPPGAPSRTGEPSRPSPDDVRVGAPLLTTRTDNGLETPNDRAAALEAATARDAQARTPGASSLYGLHPSGGTGAATPPGTSYAQTPPTVAGRSAGRPSTGGGARRPTQEWANGPQNTGFAAQAMAGSRGTALHDPAGDLNWALAGTAASLFGGFVLALMSVYYHAIILWFGLMCTFTGGFVTFMVLLTGGRGRRPARVPLSVALGTMVAFVMSTSMVATKWGAEKVIDAMDQIQFTNEGLEAGVSTPSTPSDEAATAVAPPPAPSPEEEEGQQGVPSPVEEPPPQPSPRPSPAPSPAPSRFASPPPAPEADEWVAEAEIEPDPVPAPAPAPRPAPRPAPAAMTAVPMEVIHVMLSNNLEVKRCFVPLLEANALPSRVDIKFKILPSGEATDVRAVQADFRGSALEGCLSRAVGGITFPATSGTGNAITYPFVLQ